MLVLAPGVLAVGVGERTTPGGRRERSPQRLFAARAAQTVLAVPIAQDRATMHLDTICTMVDRDAVVMYPPSPTRWTALRRSTPDGGVGGRGSRSSRPPRRARWASTGCA